MNKKLAIFLLLTVSTVLFANTTSNEPTIRELFTPIDGDLSVKILQNLFGGNKLISALASAPENVLISSIFKILNTGVLFIAGILLSYTIISNTVRMAQDAGMSQIGKLSPMTIFRIVTGFTLMSPMPNVGFSIIQVGVMWAAVHGVGFADAIYSKLDLDIKESRYTEIKNQDFAKVIEMRQPLKQDGTPPIQYLSDDAWEIYSTRTDTRPSLIDSVNKVNLETLSAISTLQSEYAYIAKKLLLTNDNPEVRMSSLSKGSIVGLNELYASTMCMAVLSADSEQSGGEIKLATTNCPEDGGANICFGTQKKPTICGSYKVDQTILDNVYSNVEYLFPQFISYYKTLIANKTKKFDSDAAELASNLICEEGQCQYAFFNRNQINLMATTIINYNNTPKVDNKIMDTNADLGWISLGYRLSEIQNIYKQKEGTGTQDISTILDKPTATIIKAYASTIANENKIPEESRFHSESLNSFSWLVGGDSDINQIPKRIVKFVGEFFAAIFGIDKNQAGTIDGINTIVECFMNSTGCFDNTQKISLIPKITAEEDLSSNLGIIVSVAEANRDLFSINPLDQYKHMGLSILASVGEFWKSLPQDANFASAKIFAEYRSVITTFNTLSAIVQSGYEFIPFVGHRLAVSLDVATSMLMTVPQIQYQYDVNNLFRYLPAAGFISIAMLLVAISFAIIIQIIPMIFYSLAVIAWLFYLIEAVVAAPLIAVGITHPEGHDFLGQAQQSFMLLLLVFLRPVLIVLGVITALAIYFCANYLLNLGFLTIFITSISGIETTFNGISNLFIIILVYGFIAIGITQMSFANIFRVIERVSIWIGGQQEQSPISQILMKIKGDLIQKSQQIAMGASTSITDGGDKTTIGKREKVDGKTKASEAINKAAGDETGSGTIS